jgi:hypothetical protein
MPTSVYVRMHVLHHPPVHDSMSKRRRSKTLEKAARAVKDSEDFVEHIFSIARGFADHHELDAGVGARGVRQALKAFDKHATALVHWFERSPERGTPEHEALAAIGTAAQKLGVPFIDATATRTWLELSATAARAAETQLQGKKLKNAPRFAAEALRATFEHHKLKVSHQATDKKQSDAVKLLCAIAKDGGDPSMTHTEAREWLIQSSRK